MKKILLLAALAFTLTPVRAATNFVIQGDNFQAKIDASAPGDTLVVQEGVYPGNLNFNKPLTVLRSGTNQIQFQGTIQITGTGNSSFQFSQFSSAVTIQAAGTVSFAQSQLLAPVNSQGANLTMSHVTCNFLTADLSLGGTNFQAYDSHFYQPILNGGSVIFKRCSLDGLVLSNNVTFEGLRITNIAPTTAIASSGVSAKFIANQCSFLFLSLNGYQAWLGYSSFVRPQFEPLLLQTNCDSVLIGNYFFSQGGGQMPAQVYCQGGTLKAYNNRITTGTSFADGNLRYGVWLRSNIAEVVNNTIFIANGSGAWNNRGIFASDGGGPILIRGNIIQLNNPGNGLHYSVDSSGTQVTSSYCSFYPFGSPVTSLNIQTANPMLASDYSLIAGSPCIDAGPPDAIYNDRDGSRNDMGYTGGPYWNPSNYTNDNPMVFYLAGSPQTVLKGVQTNILVNVGASAGH